MTFSSMLAHPESFGIDEYPTTLGRYSVTDPEVSAASYADAIAELDGYDYDKLTSEQQLIIDQLKDDYNLAIKGSRFKFYSEPLNAYSGVHTSLLMFFTELDVKDEKSADMYIALLGDVDGYFESIEGFERKKSELGLFMSAENCDAVISSINETVGTIDDNEIFSDFEKKINALEIPDEKKLSYIDEHKRLMYDEVIPAYTHLAATMEELKSTSTESGAICELPDGKAYYEYLLERKTGTDKSVDEIKQMLDNDIAYYSDLFFDTAAANPSLYDAKNYGMTYADGESEEILGYLREAMSKDYPDIPDFSANVKYMTSSGNPALYINAPIDDAGNAVIYINSDYYGGELYPTAAHEGIPGHLYQHYYLSLQDVSPIRYLLSSQGYVEGWGAYVERESYKYAGDNDPASVDMVTSNSVFVLSLITRVDIGVNYDGWSVTDVESFFTDNGLSAENAERYYYIVTKSPAQYLPYYVGWREITDLRAYAEGELGTYFNLSDFHKSILDAGPIPLKFLKPQVDAYITEKREEYKR